MGPRGGGTGDRERRTTQADIARVLGVSVGAVSVAVNGRPGVSDELRRTVQETAERLGYSPNRSAVALRTRRSGLVGLLIRNLRNPFFLDVAEGFERECAARGREVVIGSSHYDLRRELALVHAFADRAVDALALAPIGGGRAAHAWKAATGAPIVLLNSVTYAPDVVALRVHSDGAAALDGAVDHLVGLGHRRIALIEGPRSQSPDLERTEFFRASIRRHGLRGRVLEADDLSWGAIGRRLATDVRRGPGRRTTALVTNSDDAAYGVYAAARELGLVIPRDLSVVGNDDLDTSRLLDPPLTTHHVDRRGMGATAARLLLDALAQEGESDGAVGSLLLTRTVTIPVVLKVRASTGPPPAEPCSENSQT
ncbi:MAG: LacI family DNA-binding transcriptional regulator [Dermatophilaceae bacterium]